jgi:hypothetical protein
VTASRDLLDRYRGDPASFMRDVLRFEAWSKQVEIAEAVRDFDRVAVKACNASGKTAVASALVPWWLAGGPGSIVVTTAMTERQVKRVLWREVHQRYRNARGFFQGATVTDTEIFLAPDWFALGFSVDETESFQGFHGSRVLVIVDEASGVDERIFEAIEGVLAGGEAKLLLISNPLRTSGTFYDAFTKDRDLWKTITISAFDTPNLTGEETPGEVARRLVSRRWVEKAARRGEASNEYRIRVLGEFPSESEDTVVSLGDLQQAQAQRLQPGLPLALGADIARFGSDKTVIALREGNVIRVVAETSGRDLMQTCGLITETARRVQAVHGRWPIVVIDDVGLGGGVTDRLRELRDIPRIVDFNGGRKASSRDYPNRRSELWFRFAEVLPLLDVDPADEELAADLLAPTYSLASDAKRVVEPKANTKKRLRRSPDRADAVMLTCVVDPPSHPGRPARARVRISSPAGYRIPRVSVETALRDPLAEALAPYGITPYDSRATVLPASPAAVERALALDLPSNDPASELASYLEARSA